MIIIPKITIGTTKKANDFGDSQSKITNSRQLFIQNEEILFIILSSSSGLSYIAAQNSQIPAHTMIHRGYHPVIRFISMTIRAAANRKIFPKFFNFVSCRFLCVNLG
jgi:hypothetical protein